MFIECTETFDESDIVHVKVCSRCQTPFKTADNGRTLCSACEDEEDMEFIISELEWENALRDEEEREWSFGQGAANGQGGLFDSYEEDYDHF